MAHSGFLNLTAHADAAATPCHRENPTRSAAAVRTQLEREIERLIDLLDAFDGDADMEEDDPAEYSLGGADDFELDESEDEKGYAPLTLNPDAEDLPRSSELLTTAPYDI